MSTSPAAELDKATKNGHSPIALLKEKQNRQKPPEPEGPADGVVVPAAVIDALVGLALSTDAGKGIVMGFRATTGVPLDVPMRLGVQDGRLVPNPEGKR